MTTRAGAAARSAGSSCRGQEDGRDDVDGERELEPVRRLAPLGSEHARVGDEDVETRAVPSHLGRQPADAGE